MLLHRVGEGRQPQGVAAVADLPTRFLAAPAPQTLRFPGESVAGRRLTAVVAILRQPGLQVLHLRHQQAHLLAQRGIFGFEQHVLVF